MKRFGDLVAAVVLLPFAVVAGLFLLVLNPIFNKGPLLFRQIRMGKDCKPFVAYKFRSMSEAAPVKRGAFDALEENRITAPEVARGRSENALSSNVVSQKS